MDDVAMKYEENCVKMKRDKLISHYSDSDKYKRAMNNRSSLNDSKIINRTFSNSQKKEKNNQSFSKKANKKSSKISRNNFLASSLKNVDNSVLK